MPSTREHLQSVDESYVEHMRHAFGYGWRLLKASGACFVHAILPSCCTATASNEIQKLHSEITARQNADE